MFRGLPSTSSKLGLIHSRTRAPVPLEVNGFCTLPTSFTRPKITPTYQNPSKIHPKSIQNTSKISIPLTLRCRQRWQAGKSPKQMEEFHGVSIHIFQHPSASVGRPASDTVAWLLEASDGRPFMGTAGRSPKARARREGATSAAGLGSGSCDSQMAHKKKQAGEVW